MNILVTGGSGFIGKNIKESFLNEKHTLFYPTRNELNCVDDNSVDEYFKKKSFDVVIHSAAKPGHRNAADTDGVLYSNSRMVFNLLKYKNSYNKFINLGSGAIYDMRNYSPKMKESYFGQFIPADEHGYNKYILGNLFPHIKNTIDFRIFGVFGKYEDYAIRFISNAICKSIFDLQITIKQNRKFDYLYINDLMPVLDYFITTDAKHSAYNITPDSSIELLEIATIVKKITGNKHEIKVAESGYGLEYSGDNSLLKSEINSLKFTAIEKAIEELFLWYKNNSHLLNKDLLLNDK